MVWNSFRVHLKSCRKNMDRLVDHGWHWDWRRQIVDHNHISLCIVEVLADIQPTNIRFQPRILENNAGCILMISYVHWCLLCVKVREQKKLILCHVEWIHAFKQLVESIYQPYLFEKTIILIVLLVNLANLWLSSLGLWSEFESSSLVLKSK